MSRDLIKEALTEHWGERCPDFDEGCACCQAWAEFAALKAEASEGERRGLERAAEMADQLDANADDIGAAIRALIPAPAREGE